MSPSQCRITGCVTCEQDPAIYARVVVRPLRAGRQRAAGHQDDAAAAALDKAALLLVGRFDIVQRHAGRGSSDRCRRRRRRRRQRRAPRLSSGGSAPARAPSPGPCRAGPYPSLRRRPSRATTDGAGTPASRPSRSATGGADRPAQRVADDVRGGECNRLRKGCAAPACPLAALAATDTGPD